MKKLALLLIIPALAAGCGNDKPTQAERINSAVTAFNCDLDGATLDLKLATQQQDGADHGVAKLRAKMIAEGCKLKSFEK